MKETTSRRIAGWAKIVAWNVFAILLGAELITLGLYYLRTGELYYFGPPAGKSLPTTISSVESYRIHPYFGFQLRPHSGREKSVSTHNNHGFRSAWDYPRPRGEGEFLVGVFGGSVASYLAEFETRNRVIAGEVGAVRNMDPDDVVILNFAQGGFKQPQQVQILSYFLAVGQELDAVVNVDGFNEIALGALNQQTGVGVAQPSIEHVLGLQAVTPVGTSSRRETMVSARRAYGRFAEIYNRAWSGEAPETKVAVGFLWHFLRYKYHNRRFTKLRQEFLRRDEGTDPDPSWFHIQPAEGRTQEGEVAWSSVLDVWENSALAFAQLSAGAGIVSVHVLQPNQYFQTGRRFGDAERAVAISEASPYRALVPEGYRRLGERAESLRSRGLVVYPLFDLFDELEEQAYSDDCCHYTAAGSDRLARAVAKLLTVELEADSRE